MPPKPPLLGPFLLNGGGDAVDMAHELYLGWVRLGVLFNIDQERGVATAGEESMPRSLPPGTQRTSKPS